MLKLGVELYELSPTLTQNTKRLGMFGKSLGRLHAKTAVIDRHLVFVGSMNLDPRSASANTELGMFIDSPALAKELLRVVNISRLEGAYRVRLDPKTEQLQWLTMDGDNEVARGRAGVELLAAGHNMLMGWLCPSSSSDKRSRRGGAAQSARAPQRPSLAVALAAMASRPALAVQVCELNGPCQPQQRQHHRRQDRLDALPRRRRAGGASRKLQRGKFGAGAVLQGRRDGTQCRVVSAATATACRAVSAPIPARACW
jgi:hypothetical protein